MKVRVKEFDNNWKNLLKFLDDWKKKNLEDFCLKKCKSHECCTEMEHSGLSEKQIRVIFGLDENFKLDSMRNRYGLSVIRKDERGYNTDLCHGVSCPSLREDHLCMIYEHDFKPHYCTDFPFYYSIVDGVPTLEVDKCPATLNLDLKPLIEEARKNGIAFSFVKRLTDI